MPFALTSSVATPLTGVTEPNAVDPYLNATVPVTAKEYGEVPTVAVRVTEPLSATGLFVVRVVVVAALVALTFRLANPDSTPPQVSA